MMGEWSPRRAWTVVGVAGAVAAALIGARILAQPIQPYGDNGAAWIEHALRVELALTDGGLRAWDDRVVSHPVGLHATGVAAAAVSGQALGAVLATGWLWLALLATGVGAVTRALGGTRDATAAASAATFLLPAAHAAATRYHYDLPMTALLWAGLGAVMVAGARRPALAGIAGGLLLGLAASVKWTALPFAIPMLAGAALWRPPADRGRHLAACGAAALVMGLVAGAYVAAAPTSFGAGGLALGGGLGAGRLAFDPLALLVGVVSPALALCAVVPLRRWWRDRPGAALFAVLAGGQVGFLLLMVDPLDERFLLTSAPTVVAAAALGWSRLDEPARRRVGIALVACGVLVGMDFHVGPRAPWNVEVTLMEPSLKLRGLGLADSVEQRGWSRADSTEDTAEAARDALWEVIARCGGGDVGYLDGPSERGDTWWLRYRAGLDALRGRPLARELRVLKAWDVAGERFWWPDPDGVPEGSYDEWGFVSDLLPDHEPDHEPDPTKRAALLRDLGIERATLTAFEPDLVIARSRVDLRGPGADWEVAARVDDGAGGLFVLVPRAADCE